MVSETKTKTGHQKTVLEAEISIKAKNRHKTYDQFINLYFYTYRWNLFGAGVGRRNEGVLD